MKKIIPLLFAILSVPAFAQKDVQLDLKHFLGSNPFAFNTASKTNTGADFDVYRLEYYIAEIVLEHDGGTKTPVTDYWILANADVDSVYELGSFNVTNLEAIHFAIGVQESFNHKDPATYPAAHPLAPKAPSMHWGWGPGYRFLAIEGNKGTGLSETYELHCVGDDYYYTQRIPTSGADAAGKLVITLKGDYTRILEDIDMSGVIIDHGELPKNVKALKNMFFHVFTSGEGNGNTNSLTTGIEESQFGFEVNTYPNPSDGILNIVFDESADVNYLVQIFDLSGKLVEEHRPGNQAGTHSIQSDLNGIYSCRILDGVNVIANQRIVFIR